MKRTYILIILLLIILTSCGNKKSETIVPEKELYKGTQGVVIELFEKVQDEAFEQEDIELGLKVVNKGPFVVSNAKLLISLEKGFMQFENGDNIHSTNINLEGKTLILNFDDYVIPDIPTINVLKLDEQSEYHDSFILTNFCYDYRGLAWADICIDTDPHGMGEIDKPCTVQDISLAEGQGGPVAIDRIEIRMLLDNDFIRPQFKLHIVNKGTGTVIRPGTVDSVCNRDPVEGIYNSLRLNSVEFGNFNLGSFECVPTELILRKEEDFITCTLKSGLIRKKSPIYLSPLKVDISYGYMQSISKEIKIKKILTY